MRILLVMILGFILAACGEKPESVEVHGIMIGDSIKNVKDLSSYEKNDECEIVTYYKDPAGDFDHISVFEWKGKVQGISLGVYVKNLESYIDEMTELYGEPEISTDNKNMRTFKYNEKDILYKIVAHERKGKYFSVIYASELLDKNIERVQKACYGE